MDAKNEKAGYEVGECSEAGDNKKNNEENIIWKEKL